MGFAYMWKMIVNTWHVKDPCHSARSAGGWLHLNTRTSMSQWSRNGLNMPLSRHSVGTYPETSTHTTCQEFGHSHLSLMSHCGLVLDNELNKYGWAKLHFSEKKKKKRRHRINGLTLSQSPRKRGKSHHDHRWQYSSDKTRKLSWFHQREI